MRRAKIIKLLQTQVVCDKLKNIKMPVKTAYRISKLQEAMKKEIEFYQEQYKKIVEEYAEKDEQGNYKVLNENNIKIQPDKIDEAASAINELQQLEAELPDISFSLADFDSIEITPEEMSGLVDFIKEEG